MKEEKNERRQKECVTGSSDSPVTGGSKKQKHSAEVRKDRGMRA